MNAQKKDAKDYALALFKRLKELNYTFACELYTEKRNGVLTNTGTIKFIIETSMVDYFAMVTISNAKFHQHLSIVEMPYWKECFWTKMAFFGQEWNDRGSLDRYFFKGKNELSISKMQLSHPKIFQLMGTRIGVLVPEIFVSFNFVERMVTDNVTH